MIFMINLDFYWYFDFIYMFYEILRFEFGMCNEGVRWLINGRILLYFKRNDNDDKKLLMWIGFLVKFFWWKWINIVYIYLKFLFF